MIDEDEPGRLLREQIDTQLRTAEVEPDLDDVFARASQMDHESYAQLDDFDQLAPFVDAYCEHIDDELAGYEVEAERAPTAAGLRPVGRLWVGVIAVAAAAMLAIGLRILLGGPSIISADSSGAGFNDAQHGAKSSDATDEATVTTPAKKPRTPPPLPARPPSPPPDEPPADVPEAESGESEVVADAPATPSLSLDERLRQADAQAQAAWQRGDLAAAERRYRTIAKLGGRKKVAELAYGELFALVRQRGGDLKKLWAAYLRRFPNGRYAEDVRAGLCRRATGPTRDECWAEYRQRYPDGIHKP